MNGTQIKEERRSQRQREIFRLFAFETRTTAGALMTPSAHLHVAELSEEIACRFSVREKQVRLLPPKATLLGLTIYILSPVKRLRSIRSGRR